MQILELRKNLGLSQEAFAARVGLRSKGHLSQIERGETTCSIDVALAIEEMSGGTIAADSLCPDVAKVRAAQRAA
jgi:transcriptional regulator with XRE-family HTH domain